MKRLFVIITISLLLIACERKEVKKQATNPFKTEVLLKYTPIKNQGNTSFCWAYAMLATIETERLMQGDSVHLSPFYAGRMLLEEQAQNYYLSQGRHKINTRGMSTALLYLIERYGMLAYDTYPDVEGLSSTVLEREVMKRCDVTMTYGKSLQALKTNIGDLLDDRLGFKPRFQFMGGAEYTVEEFGRSVCRKDDYVALTSFTHQPFGKTFVLECADNHYRDTYLNLPIDSMMTLIEKAIRQGHAVCWEGDISEAGFRFDKGIAVVKKHEKNITQEFRQQEYEALRTTDDHCMAIIGLARSRSGKKYFIVKNSWGTDNPFGGLMYMSYNYLKLKTLAVILPRVVWEKASS